MTYTVEIITQPANGLDDLAAHRQLVETFPTGALIEDLRAPTLYLPIEADDIDNAFEVATLVTQQAGLTIVSARIAQ